MPHSSVFEYNVPQYRSVFLRQPVLDADPARFLRFQQVMGVAEKMLKTFRAWFIIVATIPASVWNMANAPFD
jgi:hypothetical protein